MSDFTKPSPSNLAIWSQVQATDPKFTKEFNRGGGFKGTSTNATWLAKQATKMFGPMGIGWGIKILDESIMQGANDDKIHRVKIQLWYIWDGQRGEVEHFGLTTFVGKNKNGLFTDEEAAKKSLTDAMSKALSMIGFAADIHLGMYDDNKYVNAVQNHFVKQEEAARAERAAAHKASEQAAGETKPEDKSNPVPAAAPAEVQPSSEAGEHSDAPATTGEVPEEDVAGLTEEQRDIVYKVRAMDQISDITDYMNTPAVQDTLQASSKVDQTRIKLQAKIRLKELGWPNKRPTESLGAKQ